MNILLVYKILFPCLMLLAVFEYFYIKNSRKKYDLKESVVNAVCALLHGGVGLVLKFTLIMTAYEFFYKNGFKLFKVNTLGNIVLLVILQDFLYYLWHRCSHRVRWLWASHVVHHSSVELNLSTAIRQSFAAELTFISAFWMPLAYLGFQPRSIIIVVAFNLIVQFIIHTEIIRSFYILDAVFNSPSHHRVHHGSNPQYIDKNFGAILIIWDKIFGTFEAEREAPQYGLTHNLENRYNIVTVNFHEFISIIADMIEDRDLRYLWMPPGWHPEPSRKKLEHSETA